MIQFIDTLDRVNEAVNGVIGDVSLHLTALGTSFRFHPSLSLFRRLFSSSFSSLLYFNCRHLYGGGGSKIIIKVDSSLALFSCEIQRTEHHLKKWEMKALPSGSNLA